MSIHRYHETLINSLSMLKQQIQSIIKQISIILGCLVFTFSGISCSNKLHPNTSDELIVYPSPPDTARFQFLTVINSSQDIVRKKSAFANFVVGADKPMGISNPYGINLFNGKLYICDMDLPGLEIIDLEKLTFEYFVPSGLGKLLMPINCFVDEEGKLYVTDTKRQEVLIFDENLKFVDSFGKGENSKPVDVFVTEDKIWVANLKSKIQIFSKDSSHKLLGVIPENLERTNEGFLHQPTNIWVTEDAVYASDFGAFKVKIYNHEGEYLRSIGGYGKNFGQFLRPKGVALDRDENMYVVDAAFENVQIFNKKDQLLMFFGGHHDGQHGGGMVLPAKVIVDYDHTKYFEKYVDKRFKLKYLIVVSNNYGPAKINVYGRIEPRGVKQKPKGEEVVSVKKNRGIGKSEKE